MSALLALVLLLLPPAAYSQTPAPADALEFVRACYTEHYKSQGFGEGDLAKRKGWFTPKLHALLAEDARREPESDDPPRLAFDPFTNAQEDADRFSIRSSRWERNRAFVEVENYFGATPLRVTLQLANLDGEWRIENMIYSRRFNLRRILATPAR
jgi:hypothetical protein